MLGVDVEYVALLQQGFVWSGGEGVWAQEFGMRALHKTRRFQSLGGMGIGFRLRA